jgi:Zn-finger protein
LSYKSWLDEHGKKHKKIMDKLSHLSDDEVIEYFRFENMVEKEPDFCPLYKDNQKCHDLKTLNCYLCACPNFRVGEEKSHCDIQSINGGQIVAKDGYIHQDCSRCSVPHKEVYIKGQFKRDWAEIMKDAIVTD